MKKDLLMKSIASFFVGACTLIAPAGFVSAETAIPADECAKELLLSYFPAPIVTETLKRFNVPQDKWAGIVKSLSNKDKDVVKIVEEKAAGMNPNPLKDPQQRQAAVKLFRDTLLQVFSDALKENEITDASKYQAMLDDIQQQKAKKFAMCMETQKKKLQQQDKTESQNVNADDDTDDNDDDDSDDDSDDADDDEDDTDQDASKATQGNSVKK